MTPPTAEPTLTRRTVVKGAAWAAPAIALAIAAPAASASTVDIGAFTLNGTCGILGTLGPGFTLTAGSAPIPAGTTISITGSGVANIGVFSVTGGTATVSVLSGTSRLVTLTADLPAGQTMELRTTLSISVAFTLSGTVTLPTDYVGTGSKPSGSVNSTLVFCSAN